MYNLEYEQIKEKVGGAKYLRTLGCLVKLLKIVLACLNNSVVTPDPSFCGETGLAF
jgi:hypothetical protein